MKNLILLLLIPVFIQCSCKQKIVEKENIISQKRVNKSGIQFRLKSVFDDSRCPKNVTCVWAGEVSVEVEVYENNVLKESKTMTFTNKNKSENVAWFTNYLKEKEIKEVLVLPYPENGKTLNPEDYYLKLEY